MNLATNTQIAIIESLVENTALTYEEKGYVYLQIKNVNLLEEEAQTIIEYLEENYIESDPAKQFKNFKF